MLNGKKDLYILTSQELLTLENGLGALGTDKADKYGKMGLSMMANGKIIERMGKVNSCISMVISTKANGLMIKRMAMGFTFT